MIFKKKIYRDKLTFLFSAFFSQKLFLSFFSVNAFNSLTRSNNDKRKKKERKLAETEPTHVNFTIYLRAAFSYKYVIRSFTVLLITCISIFLSTEKLIKKKTACKMVKLNYNFKFLISICDRNYCHDPLCDAGKFMS